MSLLKRKNTLSIARNGMLCDDNWALGRISNKYKHICALTTPHDEIN
jgi:hypothetical protein